MSAPSAGPSPSAYPPPFNFDPSNASANDLAKYGFPSRPKGGAALATWSSAMHAYKAWVAPAFGKASPRQSHVVPSRSKRIRADAVESSNWAGYVAPSEYSPIFGSTFYATQCLESDNSGVTPALYSTDLLYILVIQTDGNLVEYQGSHVLWSSGTGGHPFGQYFACLLNDGNLIVETSGGSWLWQSGTGGHATANYRMVLQNDANAVIYSPSNAVLWADNASSPNAAFTDAISVWVVPSVTSPDPLCGSNCPTVAVWNGIGGNWSGSPGLIQAGTESTETTLVASQYYFWWEDYPLNSQVPVTSPSVNGGDTVYVDTHYLGGGSSSFFLEDETTGQATSFTVSTPDVDTSTADYIVEDPGCGSTLCPFADFQNPILTGSMTYNVNYTLNTEPNSPSTMVQGNVVAQPSSITSANNFTVTRENPSNPPWD